MKIAALAALLFVLPVTAAQAIEEAHRKLILEFFELTSQEENFKAGLMAGFDANANPDQFAALPKEQRAKALKGLAEVRKYLAKNVTWKSVEADLVNVYAEAFSQKDLEKVVPLLRKPELREFFAKQVDVVGPAMEASMKIMQTLQPEIARIMTEAMTGP